MEMDVDTFLTAVYVTVDDLYQARYAPVKPRRPGPEPELSDSEVLTLALLAQWRTDRRETAFVRWVRAHWRAYFPRMLSQSAFNRRVRDLTGVLCRLGPAVCDLLTSLVGVPFYEVIDAVPVPLMRRCRGERHRLFAAEAQVGRGGSDRDWYYGCSLLDAVIPEGAISGFVVGPANTEGRWFAETLFCWRRDPTAPVPTADDLDPLLGRRHRGERRGPTGPIHGRDGAGSAVQPWYLGDAGFAGPAWQEHWRAAYGVQVVTTGDPALADHPGLRTRYAAARQIVETVQSLLVRTFGLTYPRARSAWGLLARLAAKIAALDGAVLLNHRSGRPLLSIFNPLD